MIKLDRFLWCGAAPTFGFMPVSFVLFVQIKMLGPSKQGRRGIFGMLTVLTNIRSTMVLCWVEDNLWWKMTCAEKKISLGKDN